MKAIFLRLFTWLTGRSAKLWNSIEPTLAAAFGKMLEDFLPVAEQIVLNIALSGQPGDEKKKIAFTQLQTAMIQSGTIAGVSAINSIVELALQNLKAKGQLE